VLETKTTLVKIVREYIMDISKDLCSIRVEREETDMLRGISAQDLKKAEDHINLKVDSCLNQLKSVIDEL